MNPTNLDTAILALTLTAVAYLLAMRNAQTLGERLLATLGLVALALLIAWGAR